MQPLTAVTESAGIQVTGANPGDAQRLNLRSASFLNGEHLPRSLTIDATGRLLADAMGQVTEFDVEDVVVLPGLINSHDHLEFNLYPQLGRPPYADVDGWSRDVHRNYSAIISTIEAIPLGLRWYWGLLKNLSWGVTAVMNHGEPPQNLHSGLPINVIEPFRFVHRADKRWAWFGARRIRGEGPLVFHIGEGTSDTVVRRSASFLRRVRGRGPLVGVHGIKLAREDARYLEALVWCPVSNYFLFDRTADIAALKDTTKILFGTDATISAQGTIWDQLRTARAIGHLTDAELLDSVTTTAAGVWGLGNTCDMVIARRHHPDPLESFYQTSPADICAVISQSRLIMMSETFFEDIAMDAWRDTYRAVTIGNASHRLYCPSPAALERLASIEDAPVALR